MGYFAPINAIDVSNSNTPSVVDPTNPVGTSYYRLVAQIEQNGKLHFTETNADSGNNGRAAIWNNAVGANVVYMAGNAGNGAIASRSASLLVRARRSSLRRTEN